ncbi:class I SAM-dependent methyltransferase [Nonomuraea longicatena]|uniref:Class I SAM-dependent methyltransferase n=1 Tax=Nonomuraea longicatena TaxID=83682 RepID=A0ABN1NMQ8_9ACTN
MSDIDYLTINRANWDDRVPVHVGSEFYDVAAFRSGRSTLRPFEVAEVGDVAGKRLAHLQCHFGLDTLSWARLGAEVTGLDFSEPAIEAARALAAETGLPARFVAADVYSAPQALGETYDIVYTGLGALVWLPDVTRWARTVAALLRPGGFLYLAEFHPFSDVLDDERGERVVYDYFADEPIVLDEPHTYTGPERLAHGAKVEWQHGLGAVVTALAQAGLRLSFLHEHDHTIFRRFAALEAEDGRYRMPEGRPRVPLMYSLAATR